jgi:hypothetical protein
VFTLLLPANAARRWRLAVAEPGVAFLGLIAAWQMFPLFAAPVLVALVHAVAPLPRLARGASRAHHDDVRSGWSAEVPWA